MTFLAPATTYLDADVEIGEDTVIGPGVTLLGRPASAQARRSGPRPRSSTPGRRRVSVRHAYLEGCEVHDGATIGPFAYLRPGTVVREGAKIGTFVEVKNADIGAGRQGAAPLLPR